jgi:O-antigen ligase
MKLRETYGNSFLRKGLSFLFGDDFELQFEQTFVGRLFCRIPSLSLPSYLLPLTSTLLLWYEKPLERLWAPLGNDFLPFILLLASLFLLPKKNWVIRKYHLWLAIFYLFCLLAGIIGAAKGYGQFEMLWGLAVYLQFGLVLIIGNLLTEGKKLETGLLLVSAPLVLKGILDSFGGQGVAKYSYLETAGIRIGSFIENPNIFGFILVILAISIWSFGHAQDLRHLAITKKNKNFLVTEIPVIVLLFMTGSRTAWLALVLAGIVLTVHHNWRYILIAPISLLALLIPRVRERILIVFSPEYALDSSIDGRIWALRNAIHVWQQNIFGTGPGSYGGRTAQIKASPVYLQSMQNGYTAIHTTDNQWLAILVQAGLLGMVSFVGSLFSLAVRLVKNKKSIGLALLLAFLVMMMFSNALEFGSVVVPTGLLLGKTLEEK